MKLHRVHSLDSSQIRQLQTMVNKCTDSDGTRLSFPFDEADLFLYFEHDGSIVSAIGLTILPELLRAFSSYRMLVYSVALVLIMIFRPQGIFGNWEFSLTKVINKIFYPVKVREHGKPKQDGADGKSEKAVKSGKSAKEADKTAGKATKTKEAQA